MRSILSFALSFHMFLGVSAAVAAPREGADPVLKPNDLIQLVVFEEPDLATTTRVLKSGEVLVPLVGPVKIGGLTVSQANDTIRNLYAQDFLVDPKVTLTVQEYSADFISVIGAVRSPGQFPLPASGLLDLSAAIATAGGLSPEADPDRITLTLANGETSTHSASSTQNGKAVALRPGDRVVVHQSAYVNKTATILGQVRKPGPMPFPIDGRLDLVTAIAQAGGFTELANPKKVSINRKGKVVTLNAKEMADKGDQRYFLQPEDIVTVSERFF